MDAAQYIGSQVKDLMTLITDMDSLMPDEEGLEVLTGAVSIWGTIEAQLLFPALATSFEESEPVIDAARERLNMLYTLQHQIHEDEFSEEPWSALVGKYIDAVTYHLLVDVQDLIPLASQLPQALSTELASRMSALKLDMA